MKTKKLIIYLLLAVLIIITSITACSKSNNNDKNFTDATESTFSDTATTTLPPTTTPTTEKYTVPVSELGFYNMYEMGNYLVEIDGYKLSPSSEEDDYVYVVVSTSRTFRISNGYIQYYDPIDLDTLEVKLELRTARPCNIVSNDYIDISSGDSSIKISERKTSETRDDFVVLVDKSSISNSEMWYIPINLIDVNRNAEKCVEDGENGKRTRYKLFLNK